MTSPSIFCTRDNERPICFPSVLTELSPVSKLPPPRTTGPFAAFLLNALGHVKLTGGWCFNMDNQEKIENALITN